MGYTEISQKSFTGVDTETINGKVVLMCSPKRVLLFPKTFEEIVGKLFTVKAHEAHHVFTFNLNYDTYAIFKFLPEETLKTLYLDNLVEYKGYKIMFIPGKFLSISSGGNKITIVDAQPFFHSSLDNAAFTYLKENKMSNPIIESFKKKQMIWGEPNWHTEKYDKNHPELMNYPENETLTRWLLDHLEIITKYCQKDADLTGRLGQLIDQSCYEATGFRLETYSSNAKIGEKATLRHCLIPDKSGDLNKDGSKKEWAAYPQMFVNSRSARYAKASVRGGLFATFKRGSFDETTDLDVNSAYPWKMKDLPHWANGDFVELTEEMILDIESEKIKPEYGWVGCKFNCKFIPWDTEVQESFISLYQNKETGEDEEYVNELKYNKILYPTGEREQVITLDEYYFMKKYGFPCLLENGFIWIRKPGKDGYRYVNPFGWIPGISDKKGKLKEELKKKGIDKKSSLLYEMYKIAMNGSYGKTIQSKGQGKLVNPFYGSYITAACRLKVVEFVLDNKLEDRVIAFATDGILIEGYLDIKGDDELGGWDVNHYDKTFVLGNGMLQLTKIKSGELKDRYGRVISKNNIESIKTNSRMRGISNKQDMDVKHLLEHYPKNTKMNFAKYRPVHLGEALLHKTAFPDFQKALNVFFKYQKQLQVNADKSGVWEQLNSFEDLFSNQYTKRPWSIQEYEAEKLLPKKERRI